MLQFSKRFLTIFIPFYDLFLLVGIFTRYEHIQRSSNVVILMDKSSIVIGESQKTAHISHSYWSGLIHNGLDFRGGCFNSILWNNMPQIGYVCFEKFTFTGPQFEACFCFFQIQLSIWWFALWVFLRKWWCHQGIWCTTANEALPNSPWISLWNVAGALVNPSGILSHS